MFMNRSGQEKKKVGWCCVHNSLEMMYSGAFARLLLHLKVPHGCANPALPDEGGVSSVVG